MQVKEISVTYGGKLNLGDYNSAHVEITVSAILDDREDGQLAVDQLFETAKAAVRKEARVLFEKRGARVDEIFAGLPVEVQQEIKGGK